jgi:hypothetical protein
MKSAVKITGFGLAILLLVISCERDTAIDIKPHTPSLVVHAYVAVGDTFVIAVGKTTNITVVTSAADTYVGNALVVLYENNVIADTMAYDGVQERYHSSVIAIVGKTYKVVVQAPNYKTVEATAVAPSVPNTSIVSFVKIARIDINNNKLSDITYRINDNGAEKNFYLTTLGHEFRGFFCVYTYDAAVDKYQGNLDPFETGNCIGNDEILIRDNLFNGSSRNITLSGDEFSLREEVLGTQVFRPYLKLYNISEAFYEYIKDGISVDIVEGNPFVEPHITGGNVQNGYGLFTVFSYKVDTLR